MDEIQCGLGRTGQWLAFHRFAPPTNKEMAPDMIALAKPLGLGIPLGAVILNEKVASRDPARPTRNNVRRWSTGVPRQSRVFQYSRRGKAPGARSNDWRVFQATSRRIERLACGEGCPGRRLDARSGAQNLRERNRETTSPAGIHSQLYSRNCLAPAATIHHYRKANR